MATSKYIGLVECNGTPGISSGVQVEGFDVKKFMTRTAEVATNVKYWYPAAEEVQNIEAIIEDGDIELIFVSKPGQDDLEMVGKAVRSGKNVRII